MIDQNVIAALEDCGMCLFSIKDTSLIIGWSYSDLKRAMSDTEGDVYLAYMRGRLKNEMEVRKSIMGMAKSGSTQAHQLYLELVRNLNMEES